MQQSPRHNLACVRWGARTVLLVVGALLFGGALGTANVFHGILSEPQSVASGFTTWTWLPGDRAVWVSQRPPCRAETTGKACADHSAGTGVRVVYYGPEVGRFEVTLPIELR